MRGARRLLRTGPALASLRKGLVLLGLVGVLGAVAPPASAASEHRIVVAEPMTREAAEALAAELGLPEVRVYRRFLAGAGWTHTVEVGPLRDAAAAEGIAKELEGRGLAVVRSGPEVLEAAVSEVAPSPSTALAPTRPAAVGPASGSAAAPVAAPDPAEVVLPEPDRPSAISVVRDRKAEAYLRGAGKAHLGALDGAALLGAPALEYRFTRELEGPQGRLVVRHRYTRQDRARALEVEVLEGKGKPSRSVITPGNRAVLLADGSATERDPARLLEIVERFSPEGVLGHLLALPAELREGSAWRGLYLEEGTEVPVLRPQVARDHGVQHARFDPDTGLLAEVTLAEGGDERTWVLDAWGQTAAGVLLPHRVEVFDGETLLERVQVEALVVSESVPAGTFDLPDGVGP